MTYQFIQIEIQNSIGILRLNRPDRLNAFDSKMAQEIPVGLQELLNDINVRVVIFTGNGRGFCAGADVNFLKEISDQKDAAGGKAIVSAGNEIVEMIHTADKPVIAAINGPTAGGGAGIALACDIRFMAESATISFPFIRLGLHPDLGCTYFLPRLAGPAKAAELFMTGESLSAKEALHLKIVNKVVPDSELLPATLALAKKIAEKSPIALRLLKKGMKQAYDQPFDAMLKYEIEAQNLCFESKESAEAIKKFVESRKKR